MAVKRRPKINGRKNVLINSIRAITGPIGKKRSLGVWCFKNLCGLVANHEKTAAPHKEKLIQKIIFGKVWMGNQEPDKLITQKKDIQMKIFSPSILPPLGDKKNIVMPDNIWPAPNLKNSGEKTSSKKVSILKNILSILNKIAIFWCRLLYTNLATTYA